MSTGQLYVFEGADGVGKTTLATALVSKLRADGRNAHYLASPGRERGTLGRLVWEFHHDSGRFGVDRVDPTSLQLLHVAAHIDTIEHTIWPALRAGQDVVMDRFWWSTLVYGAEQGVSSGSLDLMIQLEMRHWGGLSPNLVFLLTCSRPFRDEISPTQFNRLTAEYLSLAEANPSTVLVENNSSVDVALNAILQHIVSHPLPPQ